MEAISIKSLIDVNLKDKEDIKILICYIFTKLEIRLTKDMIIYCLQNSGIANFFNINGAFSELLENEILKIDSKNVISMSEKGFLIYESLGESLSQNIKDRAINAILDYVKMLKNISENNVLIEKLDPGYSIKCSISGGNFDLMSLSVFAPDIESAITIKKNFYKNLEDIYSTVLSKLIVDYKHNDENSCFII